MVALLTLNRAFSFRDFQTAVFKSISNLARRARTFMDTPGLNSGPTKFSHPGKVGNHDDRLKYLLTYSTANSSVSIHSYPRPLLLTHGGAV
jgi:hypothetical protein